MSESLTGTCKCERFRGSRVVGPNPYCLACGKKIAEQKENGAKMPDERRKFAERLIKHHKRIIHEIEQEYGLGQ